MMRSIGNPSTLCHVFLFITKSKYVVNVDGVGFLGVIYLDHVPYTLPSSS